MPQAVIGIIGSITGTAVSAGVTAAVYAGFAIATIALSNSQKRKAERQARAQYEASVVDRLVTAQSAIAPRELVMGRTRKGGAVFFQSSVAPHNAVYVAVLALAAHEIDAVEQIYFDEKPVDLDADGNVTTAPWGRWNKITVRDTSEAPTRTLAHTPIPGTLTVIPMAQWGTPEYFFPSGANSVPYTLAGNVLTITDPQPGMAYTVSYQWEQFVSTARVFKHLGSPDQAADSRLQLLLPGTWTAAHRARGVAYLECEFVYEETSFPTGLPNVTALVRGAKCFDPRTGLTQFTENPAIMARHVLMHPQFGKRTSLTAAEDARIVAAANACDIGLNYGAGVLPMYRSAIVVPFGTPARDVLDDLAQAMAGEWAYAGAQYFTRAGVYQAPVMHLTDSDLAVVQRTNDGSTSQSSITISPHKPRNEKINTVAARIWDQFANYIETPVTPYRAVELIAEDGAEITQEVVMPAVFYAPQAMHISSILLRDARDPMIVKLPFKLRAYPLELFDTVTLTLARYGWTNKEFRILGRTLMPEGYVLLTFKETTAAIFAYGGAVLPDGYADNSGLPKPWEINPPTITSITSGEEELIVQSDGTVVNGVRVAWSPIQEASIESGGNVEVQWSLMPEGQWRSIVVPGDATEAKFTGVDDLAVIVIRARTFNSLAKSAWSSQILHQVIGKTAPPPNIQGLSVSGSVLSWTLPGRVPDLAGFVFRFHYGSNTDWNSAAPLHTGVLTESPYDLVTRPGGVVTIMGKAIDTSGNMSSQAALVVMNLGDPPVANILEVWDFKALDWPADSTESSGWTEVADELVANATDAFYGDSSQRFYRADSDPFYRDETYAQLVYVTRPVAINSALAGSIMTLISETAGVDLRIDYRLSGPGPFYGEDGDVFFGPDDSAFFGTAGPWTPWPGQLSVANDVYQFRVTLGASGAQAKLKELVLTIDAPDIEERFEDLAVPATGLVIPYTKNFTSISNVQITLQKGGSAAVTAESDKSIPLAPKVWAYNSAHVAVAGATVDVILKGY